MFLQINEINIKDKVYFVNVHLLVVFLCVVTSTVSDTCTYVNACKCQFTNGSVLDLTPLASNTEARWKKSASLKTDAYIYYYNPCINFKIGNEGTECADGVAVCQVDKNETEYHSCGVQKHAFFGWDSNNSAVVLSYHSADNYRSTNVTLVCSSNPPEKSELKVIGEKSRRYYEMVLTSICACPDGCTEGGLSFGSGLVIIFFISVLIYLCLGIIYNHLVRGAHGCELIPQQEFWKDFPLLVKDGCIYVSSGCRRETSYERI